MNGHVARWGTNRVLFVTSCAHFGECKQFMEPFPCLFLRVHPKRNSRKRSLLALVLSLVPHHTPPEMDIQGPIKLEMKTQGYVSPSSPHIFALSGTHIFCDLRSCCSYVSLVYGREEITCDHRNFRRASANHFYMKNEILQLQFPLPCK